MRWSFASTALRCWASPDAYTRVLAFQDRLSQQPSIDSYGTCIGNHQPEQYPWARNISPVGQGLKHALWWAETCACMKRNIIERITSIDWNQLGWWNRQAFLVHQINGVTPLEWIGRQNWLSRLVLAALLDPKACKSTPSLDAKFQDPA